VTAQEVGHRGVEVEAQEDLPRPCSAGRVRSRRYASACGRGR
jgi:hypothetical protein